MAFFSFASFVAKATFAKPTTRLYPFEKRKPFAATRGHIKVELKDCSFCTLCAKKCPTDAIEVDRQGRIWRINRLRCIQCRACVDACNKGSLSLEPEYSPAMTSQEVESFQGPPAPPKPAPAATPAA